MNINMLILIEYLYKINIIGYTPKILVKETTNKCTIC